MIDKTKYNNIEIPDDLNSVVKSAIDEGMHRGKKRHMIRRFTSVAAIFFVCIILFLNISPVFAETMYKIPVLGNLCRVFTFREYHTESDIINVDVKIPQIEDNDKSDLDERVNLEIQKVVKECLDRSEERAKEYYDAFIATGGNPEDYIPVEITVDYEVKYISEEYASFVVYQYEDRFNAYNYSFYYNLDLETGKNVTLRDLYGTNYREIVAGSIEETIEGWNDEQKSMLWEDLSFSDLISEDTKFYLNENGEVVVVFEKYQIAVGTAGELEFVIEKP